MSAMYTAPIYTLAKRVTINNWTRVESLKNLSFFLAARSYTLSSNGSMKIPTISATTAFVTYMYTKSVWPISSLGSLLLSW